MWLCSSLITSFRDVSVFLGQSLSMQVPSEASGGSTWSPLCAQYLPPLQFSVLASLLEAALAPWSSLPFCPCRGHPFLPASWCPSDPSWCVSSLTLQGRSGQVTLYDGCLPTPHTVIVWLDNYWLTGAAKYKFREGERKTLPFSLLPKGPAYRKYSRKVFG